MADRAVAGADAARRVSGSPIWSLLRSSSRLVGAVACGRKGMATHDLLEPGDGSLVEGIVGVQEANDDRRVEQDQSHS